MQKSIGILLVNLGTPNSPSPKDVYRYLIEFLTDGRVIDLPWFLRQLLVRGVIVPTRYKQSARSYREIWTTEGSPLMVYSQKLKQNLQTILSSRFHVEIAMRYQQPSIKDGIKALLKKGIDHLFILPLFPQYASATTGSVHEEVMSVLKELLVIPQLTFLNDFATHPAFIDVFQTIGRRYPLNEYDHFLFSFHGLPQRHLKKADQYDFCLKKKDCCQKICAKNKTCYSAQCYGTALAIAKSLDLPEEKFSICFQSRLGKDAWIQPYTSEMIQQLSKKGCKKVLVFCPSFVCDCLETIFEIGVEYAHEFKQCGGERLDLVKGLNDEPKWVEALKTIILDNLNLEGLDFQDILLTSNRTDSVNVTI